MELDQATGADQLEERKGGGGGGGAASCPVVFNKNFNKENMFRHIKIAFKTVCADLQ